MDNLLSSQAAPQTAADYETLVEQMLAEMQRLNQQMQSDRADIDRLKADSRMLKAETRALLTSMGAQL